MLAMTTEKFLYFAYGSNLLKQRLQLKNPTAVYKTTAKLMDFRLSFFITINPKTSRWNGAAATIAPAKGSSVWGTVWELSVEDIPSLDRQEGIYKALNVDVISEDRSPLTCRTYLLEPTTVPSDWDMRPSPQYMDIIIRGAIQSNLPEEYISQLKNIEHNNYSGSVKVYDEVLKLLNTSS
ncbi:gamma-glutamylcyclotransferase-like [Mytilus galloprovincialis]|uniref:gamma-glutamylcyclotransferase-like n=1 Tax=Mytilus galloprovincialis TaxID=29158 RepID=UPI003F7B6530